MTKVRACRACGKMVSRGAKACPSCGKGKPGRAFTERHPLMALGFIGFIVYVVATNVSPTATEPGGSEEMVVPGAVIPEAPAPPPAECLTPSPRLIADIASGLEVAGG